MLTFYDLDGISGISFDFIEGSGSGRVGRRQRCGFVSALIDGLIRLLKLKRELVRPLTWEEEEDDKRERTQRDPTRHGIESGAQVSPSIDHRRRYRFHQFHRLRL